MLTQAIEAKLKEHGYWTQKTVANGKHVNHLLCPQCREKEAFAYSGSLLAICCHRLNKCGETTKTTSLFPEIFRNIEEDQRPTKQDPNLPATYFLQLRGLNRSIQGLKYKYARNIRKSGSGGVLFYVGKNSMGEEVWNGRIFDPPQGEQKGAGYGNQEGLFWQHPAIQYDPKKPTFVTEGVIDALSLIEMGYQAIAILASGRKPSKIDLSWFENLIFAFDNDTAGRSAFRKWREKLPNSGAVATKNGDWNDILIFHASDSAQWIQDNMEDLEFHGSLASSFTANEYAERWVEFKGSPPYLFDFKKRMYYATGGYNGAGQLNINCRQVGNFTLRTLNYQLDNSVQDEPVYRYTLEIARQGEPSTEFVATAMDLSTAGQLTKLFLMRSRTVWSGDASAVTSLLTRITTAKVPIVRQLITKGFDPDSGCYVFRTFAINPAGQLLLPNKSHIYRLDHRNHIRAAQFKDLDPNLSADIKQVREIYRKLRLGWGHRASISIGWLVASWFVTDIKAKARFFPFLSFWGDSQTGKSNLTTHLNAMQCLDEEGLPMKASNTEVGVLRTLSQRSCLAQALLEEAKDRKSKFDYRFLLTAYNDAPLQVRGTKTMDNQTSNLELKAGVMFVQNREPFTSKPERERVISLRFSREQRTMKSKGAFDDLLNVPKSDFGAVYIHVMRNHQDILKKWPGEYARAKQEIACEITDHRIVENHAIVLAFHRLFCKIIGTRDDIINDIIAIARDKQRECAMEEVGIAQYFFEMVMGLEQADIDKDEALSFSVQFRPDIDELRLHLPGVLKGLGEMRFRINFGINELQDALESHSAMMTKKAVKFAFIDARYGAPARREKTNRAYIFRLSTVVDSLQGVQDQNACINQD